MSDHLLYQDIPCYDFKARLGPNGVMITPGGLYQHTTAKLRRADANCQQYIGRRCALCSSAEILVRVCRDKIGLCKRDM